MSSKNRKNRAQQNSQNVASRPSAASNRNAGTGARGGNSSRRGPGSAAIMVGALVVLGVGALFAINNTKPKTTSANAPSTQVTAESSVPVPSPAAAPPAPGPKIQFTKSVYDFGKVTGDELVNCLFSFTNVGNAVLELSEVTPACGCMKIGEWTRKVEPGKTGSIAVQYDSHHYTGRFAKSVFVTCNDPAQPKPMLEIQGNVWRAIELSPESANMEVNSETPSNAVRVRIVSNLDQPLHITNLQNDNPAFATELQTNQPGKEYQLLVKTAPPFPTATQQGRIILKTTSTNVPEIEIKARANVLPLVMPIPYLIRVPPLPLTTNFAYTVWVRNNSTNSVSLSEAAVNAKGVEVQIKEDPGGKQFTLPLNFPAGFDIPSGESVELSVKTSHPKVPVIKVPVVQPPRAAPVTSISLPKASAGAGNSAQ